MAFGLPDPVGAVGGVIGAALDDLQGLLGNLTNPFGPAGKGEWDLKEASFINETTGTITTFWISESKKSKGSEATALSQISDGGGRRLAIYQYPYRDGQLVEDLGRRGERFTFEIKFFGQKYRGKLNEFIQNVAGDKGRGKLSHPVRGIITARFQEWEFIHRHDEWNAVSIRATFIEDNQDDIAINRVATSTNMSLRSALQAITDAQAFISESIFRVSALLLIPDAIRSALVSRLSSIGGQLSRLFGQIAATFSRDDRIRTLALQAQSEVNGFVDLYSAKILTAGKKVGINGASTTTIPPLYQVGYAPADQAAINIAMSQFLAASTITPQQAVYSTNQVRASISSAITEIRDTFGNEGYEIELSYREMAVQIQQAVESAISSANAQVRIYTVPRTMSLRMVAFLNGLDKDKQNDIEQINPYLPSINFIPAGTTVIVPAAAS